MNNYSLENLYELDAYEKDMLAEAVKAMLRGEDLLRHKADESEVEKKKEPSKKVFTDYEAIEGDAAAEEGARLAESNVEKFAEWCNLEDNTHVKAYCSHSSDLETRYSITQQGLRAWCIYALTNGLSENYEDNASSSEAQSTPQSERRTIADWQSEIGEWAVDKGWLDRDNPRDPLHLIALAHGELSEMQEGYRNPDGADTPCDKDGCNLSIVEEEYGDVFIRLAQQAEELGIDLEKCVRLKHEYNQTRSRRHGGKLA